MARMMFQVFARHFMDTYTCFLQNPFLKSKNENI